MPQRALQRVAVELRIRAARPTMRPACGPPSSLSPLKVTRSAPAAIASRDRGLVCEAVTGRDRPTCRCRDPRPAASHARAPAPRKLARRDGRREALDGVVAGVHLHEQRGARADRRGIVLEMGAVGGADLDQLAPARAMMSGMRNDAADLDQLAARDDRLAAVAPGCSGPAARRRRCC